MHLELEHILRAGTRTESWGMLLELGHAPEGLSWFWLFHVGPLCFLTALW